MIVTQATVTCHYNRSSLYFLIFMKQGSFLRTHFLSTSYHFSQASTLTDLVGHWLYSNISLTSRYIQTKAILISQLSVGHKSPDFSVTQPDTLAVHLRPQSVKKQLAITRPYLLPSLPFLDKHTPLSRADSTEVGKREREGEHARS